MGNLCYGCCKPDPPPSAGEFLGVLTINGSGCCDNSRPYTVRDDRCCEPSAPEEGCAEYKSLMVALHPNLEKEDNSVVIR